jgi:MYXO-CTERM domain-containing protein
MRARGVRSGARAGGTLAAAAVLLLAGTATREARAFCRTTTCGLPANFAPTDSECHPADYEAWCASQNPPAKILPVYWSNACVGYDIQQDASRQVPYATAATLFATAFSKWTGTSCAGPPGSGRGDVSISVQDLGPVACNQVQYSSNQGNQHVIIFHDDVWPHDDASNTLGLTTITFNPDTGEIYDADMEINSTPSVPLSLADPVPPDGYDLQSIITHETGHFLGMAHSGDVAATMFAHYVPGTISMRVLSQDDRDGICSIDLPNGTRSVDPSVSPNGALQAAACDPTPRHGFQSSCAQPEHSGCSAAPTSDATGFSGTAGLMATALLVAARARRRPQEPREPRD